MTKADGLSKIDAVEVGELSFTVIGPPTPVLAVKFAYANSATGDRFGYGNRNTGWSKETMDCLASLVGMVEADVCRQVFGDSATTSSVQQGDATTSDGVPSL